MQVFNTNKDENHLYFKLASFRTPLAEPRVFIAKLLTGTDFNHIFKFIDIYCCYYGTITTENSKNVLDNSVQLVFI